MCTPRVPSTRLGTGTISQQSVTKRLAIAALGGLLFSLPLSEGGLLFSLHQPLKHIYSLRLFWNIFRLLILLFSVLWGTQCHQNSLKDSWSLQTRRKSLLSTPQTSKMFWALWKKNWAKHAGLFLGSYKILGKGNAKPPEVPIQWMWNSTNAVPHQPIK